jgi:hypothetical protein
LLTCADIIQSEEEAVLGDPNFPRYIMRLPELEPIGRIQRFYERYTQLSLTHHADRPIAISALQDRILAVLGGRGGFGVIDHVVTRGVFNITLLWCRAPSMGPTGLTRIEFPVDMSIGKVPSWSWMAYMGSIAYLNVNLATVVWKRLSSPWSSTGEFFGIEILAGAQTSLDTFFRDTSLHEGHIFMDDPYTEAHRLRVDDYYVVLGIEGGSLPLQHRIHYALIVRPIPPTQNWTVCERIGVGALPGRYLDSSQVSVIIV